VFDSWQGYFATGAQYTQKTGKAWFDSSTRIFAAMHDQLPVGYFDENDELVIDSTDHVETNWGRVTGVIGGGQSAELVPFTSEWNDGLRTGAFATVLAPPWALGLIEHLSGPLNKGKWALSEVFPGGGGNWGGTYLAVAQGTGHPEDAAALAAWLTAPEQQLRVFDSAGTFPGQVEALASAELLATGNEYFGDVETGRLYATLASKVPTPHYRTRHDSRIHEEAITPALLAVEGGTPPDQAWQQAVTAAKDIVGG
jgi:cellobiose transport system substrate-binding protein